MTIGHVEHAQKQHPLIKQSSLVDQEVSPTRRTRAERQDRSFNETIKSASKTQDTIDFTILPGNHDQKDSTAKFNSNFRSQKPNAEVAEFELDPLIKEMQSMLPVNTSNEHNPTAVTTEQTTRRESNLRPKTVFTKAKSMSQAKA